MRAHVYHVDIVTNRRGTLYTGMTNELGRRLHEHRSGTSTFTNKYRIGKLIYFEQYGDVRDAIAREKEIKGWTREKKLALIRTVNPAMKDLAYGWFPDLTQHVRTSRLREPGVDRRMG